MVCILVRYMESYLETIINMNEIVEKLQAFIEIEGKSCSFDPKLIKPEYVYRIWVGAVAIEDIASAMENVRRMR